MVGAHARRGDGWPRPVPHEVEVLLRPDHEEGSAEVHEVEAGEVGVAAVHDVERARLEVDLVQHMHISGFPGRYVDERRDVPAQVEQGVELHRGLGRAEVRPREEVHAQVDSRRVERVDGLAEIDIENLARVESPRFADQRGGDTGIDSPVADIVGVGEGRARDPAAKTHVVEMFAARSEARFDVAQALPVGELGERHAEKLITATEGSGPQVTGVPADAPVEDLAMERFECLRENCLR